MAAWSKALPLTASCLSPLHGFKSWPGHVTKLPVTWGWAVVFPGSSSFLHILQYDRKSDENMKLQIGEPSWCSEQ